MGHIRNLIKRITNPFLKKGFEFYHRKPRVYNYENIEIIVHQDVFPPHLTLSTKILLDYINTLDFNNKSLLELGCGSGIISLFAAKKGANVTASDINKTALEFLNKNAIKNKIELEIIYSNLFEAIGKTDYDYVIINPPYYPKKPRSIKEQAWFCGENFEYFESLFEQIHTKISCNSNMIMILSEDCEIAKISKIANKNKLVTTIIQKTKQKLETNYIFTIEKALS